MTLATTLPTVTFDAVWHVGTLDPGAKQATSYEGQGLSVSLHPQEWTAIARLGNAPTWRLTRPGNVFLDHRALTADQRAEITAWGLTHDFLTPVTVYRVDYLDMETGEARHFVLTDAQEGTAEAGEAEDASGLPATLTEVAAFAATVTFPDPTVRPGDLDPHDALAAAWVAATQPTLDGVWWNDDYDPDALQWRPRGVIRADRLTDWTLALEQTEEVEPRAGK